MVITEQILRNMYSIMASPVSRASNDAYNNSHLSGDDTDEAVVNIN